MSGGVSATAATAAVTVAATAAVTVAATAAIVTAAAAPNGDGARD